MSAHLPKLHGTARIRVRPLGAVVGTASLAVLGTLSMYATPPDSATVDIPLAGSGSAPANTTFVQPAVGAMSLGNTVTTTTPPTAPAVSMAVPPIKAGH